MHPIVSEQIARSRMEELHRQAAVARRYELASRTSSAASPRLALASASLRLARALDRDGRVVPAAIAP